MQSEIVIGKFGGQTALARLLGKSQSTIQHWAKSGRIPAKWQPELLRLARERGIDLAFSDFVEGAPHSHVVQFYEDDAFLIHRVAHFLGSAIEAGNACIVIATEAHRKMLLSSLHRRGFDMAALERQGSYISLDANQTLAKFMVNGLPDKSRCLPILKQIVDKANAAAKCENPCAAAFGEMVALLWKRGKDDAAIALECLWNELVSMCDFSLLCGYPISGFQRKKHSCAFLEICNQHADVIPAESYSTLPSEPERHRSVARLQQRMQALESEAHIHERRILMFENVTDAASWELDLAEDMVCLSPKAQRVLGLLNGTNVPLSELLQRIHHSTEREAFVNALRRARFGTKELTVEFLVRSERQPRLIYAKGRTFFNRGQPLILGIFAEKPNTTAAA